MTADPEWPLSDYRALELGDGRVLVVGATAAQLWDPTTGSWRAAEPLPKERHEFAAIDLEDGRVLVAGGLNGEPGSDTRASYSSAYVFDPGSETWTKVGLMGTARSMPSIARLPDDRVLVAGGYFYTGWPTEGRADPGIELAAYRPADTESRRVPLGDVDVPPVGYALATAEMFDPATGEWKATGPMRYARAGAAVVTLSDGRVLVVGSGGANVTGLSPDAYRTAEIYDPATGRFSPAGRLPAIDRAAVAKLGVTLPGGDPEPATLGSLAAIPGSGAVLVGNAVWWKHQGELVRSFRFDATAVRWSEVDQPHAWAFDDAHESVATTAGTTRIEAQVAPLSDGKVLVAGGDEAYQNVSEVAASAEYYDPATNTWTDLPDMPQPRAEGCAVALGDGSVLLVGGTAGWDQGGSSIVLSSAVRLVPSN